jgi:hypothetical protein
MGRHRKHDKHLPQRVYHRGKTYYFVDHTGKWLSLGRTVGDMHRAYAAMVEERPIGTMNDLFDRYVVEVIPYKAARTQRDNRYEMRFLRAALRSMVPSEVRPRDGYADGPVRNGSRRLDWTAAGRPARAYTREPQ